MSTPLVERPVTERPAAFRAAFPMLAHTTYLASCSLGARSLAVERALTAMLDEMAGPDVTWDRFQAQVTSARAGFANLIRARPEQVALVPNATTGAYQAVSGLEFTTRTTIVTSDVEFPSIAHVWLGQRTRGATVAFAGAAPAGKARPAADRETAGTAQGYLAVIDQRTALVSVPLVTYRHAVRPPVAEITAAARAAGAVSFVDAYQALGVSDVDVTELGCDFLVGGTSKYLLGLPGLAFLYVRDVDAVVRPPSLTGWFGRVDPFAFDPRRLDFPDEARRYETGTAPVPAVYAGNAGLELLGGVPVGEVARHVGDLVTGTISRLTGDGHRVLAAPERSARGAHVALLAADPVRLARQLAAHRVSVSPRGDVVRLAFHYYNDFDDVDRLCRFLWRYRAETR